MPAARLPSLRGAVIRVLLVSELPLSESLRVARRGARREVAVPARLRGAVIRALSVSELSYRPSRSSGGPPRCGRPGAAPRVFAHDQGPLSLSESSPIIRVISHYPSLLSISESSPIIRVLSRFSSPLSFSETSLVIRVILSSESSLVARVLSRYLCPLSLSESSLGIRVLSRPSRDPVPAAMVPSLGVPAGLAAPLQQRE